MGVWGKLMWLQLVLMLPVLVASRQTAPPRNVRLWDSWLHNYPAAGYGALQDFARRYPEEAAQPRQLSAQNTISVQCAENQMVVRVQRDLYGTGKLVKPSDLTLGPQQCNPSSMSTDTVVIFQNGLQACGNSLQMTQDWLIYSTNLTYNPSPSGNAPIIRTNSAVVLIQCYYPRYGNVSSNAIKPTWYPFSSTVSIQEKLMFSLHLMNDDWSSPRTSTVYQLGDIFHIEASIDMNNHVPMVIYIDSCIATLSSDVTSNPRYEIIAHNGCLVDGKQEDSSSAFRSPRVQSEKIQFSVDAFRFTGIDTNTIYITCVLRAAAATQIPDPTNKACSYSKSINSWTPLEGTGDICKCCDNGNCLGSIESRRVDQHYYTGGRRVGKRQAAPDPDSEQEHGLATLGPILIIGPDNKALAMTQESKHLELIALVTAGCLSLIILAVCIAVIGSLLFKKQSPLQAGN